METPYPFDMFWDQFSQLSTLLYLSELSLTPTHPHTPVLSVYTLRRLCGIVLTIKHNVVRVHHGQEVPEGHVNLALKP